MTPRCSIIIPTYNTCHLTLSCLAQIRKHPPSENYEVIIVDNNSTDETCEQVRQRFPDVTILRNSSNVGFARACNRGTHYAQGKYFLFLNSDTEPLPGTFDTLIHWMETHPRTGIVGPELTGSNLKLLQMSWGWNPLLAGEFIQQFFAPYSIRQSKLKQYLIQLLQKKSRNVPSICGACLMIRREVFEQIHGFDEDFELYFEDSDLCFRCVHAGWCIDFDPESKIIHHLGQSTQGGWSMTSLIYQQSHITYYRKHAPWWAVYLLKFYLMFKWLRLLFVSRLGRVNKHRSRIYCQWYFHMISESTRFHLIDRMDT